MQAPQLRRLAHAVLAIGLLALPPAALAAAEPLIAPVAGLRADFMKGADISMLAELEAAGVRFSDSNGVQKDLLLILRDNGINWIRLRLWHTPRNAEDVVGGGKTLSRKGDPVGGGSNDLATTVALAKRAKALGLQVLLDFHYSDFWADPEKQTKPAAWRNLHGAALEAAVYQYTRDSLAALRQAGAYPDMVQIGNELNGGMLWPDGKTWKEKPEEEIGGPAGFAALLAQGIRAVRESDVAGQPRALVAVHLANGASNDLYRRVFDDLSERNLDYDLIGLSFYPYWHGSIEDLRANMDDISARYGKQVAVLETAYAYTTADGDSYPNLFSAANQKSGGYKASVQGQASLVRDVIDAVAQVPGERGRGVFYWEPAWIPARGVGWRTGEGNAWDNQAMFDFQGRALPSLAVFRRVDEAGGSAPQLASQAPLHFSAFVGESWTPPPSVRLAFNDDAERNVAVEWDSVDPARLKQAGRFTLKGELLGVDGQISAEVEVAPRRNLVLDPSFEKGELAPWVVSGDSGAASIERNPGNAHSGLYSFHYWKGEPFKLELSQRFTGLPPGSYALRAWAAGGGGEKALTLFARDCGGAPQQVAMQNTGWQKWAQYSLRIEVKQDQCTIGLAIDGQTGNWGNLDDIEFVREGS